MKVRTRIVDLEARRLSEPEEIDTGAGVIKVPAGDYLIKGLDGRETPVSEKLFPELYDLVDFDPKAKHPAKWLANITDPDLKKKADRLAAYLDILEANVSHITVQEAQDEVGKKP